MNKLIRKATIILFVLCAIPLGYLAAQQVFTADQKTIEWNESTSVGVLEGTYSYEVYTLPEGGDKTVLPDYTVVDATLVGETTDLTETITFTAEGNFVIGVRTKRVLADDSVVYSDMNWSDVNGESTPTPFVVRYILPPEMPLGLR